MSHPCDKTRIHGTQDVILFADDGQAVAIDGVVEGKWVQVVRQGWLPEGQGQHTVCLEQDTKGEGHDNAD